MTTRPLLALVTTSLLALGFAPGAHAQDAGFSLAKVAVGKLFLSGGDSYSGGATVNMNSWFSGNGTITSSGAGLTLNGAGLYVDSGANSYSGTLTINSGTTIASSGTITVSGGVLTLSGATNTVTSGGVTTTGAGTLTFALGNGATSIGDASLTLGEGTGVTNAGTITLNQNSAYTGTTTIAAGTLILPSTALSSTGMELSLSPAAVPEPTSYLMAAIAAAAFLTLRRRQVSTGR